MCLRSARGTASSSPIQSTGKQRHDPRRYSTSQPLPAASQSLLNLVGVAEAEEASAVQVRDSDACLQEDQRLRSSTRQSHNQSIPRHFEVSACVLPSQEGPAGQLYFLKVPSWRPDFSDLHSFDPQLSKDSCLGRYREASQRVVGAEMRTGKHSQYPA